MRKYKPINDPKDGLHIQKLRILINRAKTLPADHFYFSGDNNYTSMLRVMNNFPKFAEQIQTLFEHRIITYEDYIFHWNEDDSSLALYFKNQDFLSRKEKSGDFWGDIETAFSKKKGSLRHLASKNGRGIGSNKPGRNRNYKKATANSSKGYEKIQKLFPSDEEEKYYDKIQALEDIFDEHSGNYFWKDDGKDTSLIEFCEAKFDEIRKIIGAFKNEPKN
jgi:hypothetical protein